MSREKQFINDLIEIFDEEYGKRNLITPQNTAEKLTAKGYRKASDVAEEIFGEIEKLVHKQYNMNLFGIAIDIAPDIAELKKKYTKGGKGQDG